MKVFGIILLVFAVLNLIVAIIGATAGAPADVVGGKFSGALMLGAIGGVLCYNGSKKKDKKENDKM
jgi:Na+/citrate or Na+/malate symporter